MTSNPYILIDESPSEETASFVPTIFASQFDNEPIPAHFNTVRIVIDGRADGSLDWKQARLKALNAIGKGLKILWEIDLGFPHNLQASLSDNTQFLTLGLSLDHFRDSLWKEMHMHSIGLCLYNGGVEFSHLPTSAESAMFHRDAMTEYLDLLAMRIPDAIPLFIILDTSSVKQRFVLAELINKDTFARFQRFVTNGILPAHVHTGKQLGYLAQDPQSLETKPAILGICLPNVNASDSQISLWEDALVKINELNVPYRFIPESSLAVEWDGLDYILVMSSVVSTQGIRRLRGFCAAGGTVITIGDPLDVAQEIKFDYWDFE